MVERRAINIRVALAIFVLMGAVLACSAPTVLGRLLQNPENNDDAYEVPLPAINGNMDTPALLPNFQGDESELASSLPRYDIDVSVDFDTSTLRGVSVVTYTNTESIPLTSLYFRLLPTGQKSYGDGSLSVSGASADGRALETVSSLSDSVLEVKLPETLDPGGRTRIELQFSGIIPVDFGSGSDSRGYGIYNKSEQVLALAGWYPILAVYDEDGWNLDAVSAIGDSVYSETARYDVEVTTREDMVLVSTGVTVSRQAEGELVRHHLVSGPVRDFFIIMSPDFQRKSKTVDGVLVNSFYRTDSSKAGDRALAVASRALRLFNLRFGSYPYGELDVVEAPLFYAQGVEFPTVVLISSNLYSNLSNPFFSDVVVHEVAHQWWYSVVGNDVFDDPWLDEALAMYMDGLYLEETAGVAGYEGFIRYITEQYDSLITEGIDAPVAQSLGYFEEKNDLRIYSGVVYSKGALFFSALREEIGDEAFFKALQDYYQDHRYGVARPDDLLGAFEAAAEKSLSDFYQEWLYTGGEG